MLKKSTVTLQIPVEAWGLLLNTLEVDSRSTAFDRALRDQIADALKTIKYIPQESPS